MLLVLGDGSAQAPLRCQDPQSCRVVLLPSEPVQVDDTIIIYQEDRRAGLTRSSIDRGKQQSAVCRVSGATVFSTPHQHLSRYRCCYKYSQRGGGAAFHTQ